MSCFVFFYFSGLVGATLLIDTFLKCILSLTDLNLSSNLKMFFSTLSPMNSISLDVIPACVDKMCFMIWTLMLRLWPSDVDQDALGVLPCLLPCHKTASAIVASLKRRVCTLRQIRKMNNFGISWRKKHPFYPLTLFPHNSGVENRDQYFLNFHQC